MGRSFYPFVDNPNEDPQQDAMAARESEDLEVRYPARIAVYDDAAAAPRVVIVDPKDVRPYLEEITATVVRLAKEQGGAIPFMVIREVVENFIHAYFIQPTISILDKGNTIRFSDQGPGIREKGRALEYGTSSATEEMKQYIRGVGSGLPYAQQYMEDKGGYLDIEDNIAGGTVVTISTHPAKERGHEVAPRSVTDGAPYQGFIQPSQQAQVMAPWTVVQRPIYQGTYQQAQGIGYVPQPYYSAPQAMPIGQYPVMGQQAGTEATMPATMPAKLAVSERGRQILSYLLAHESVAVSEAASICGCSQSTSSREIGALEQAGLVHKTNGTQRRSLTSSGRALLGGVQ